MTDSELRRQLADAISALGKSETELAEKRATIARIQALADEHPAGIDTALIHEALDQTGPAATQATEPGSWLLAGTRDLTIPEPEPSDPTQCDGEEGFCPEHGFHRHSLKQPGPA